MLLLSHTYKRHTTSPFYNLGLGISLKNLDDLAARCSCSRYFERTFKIPKWQFSTLFFCTSASEIPTLLYTSSLKKVLLASRASPYTPL